TGASTPGDGTARCPPCRSGPSSEPSRAPSRRPRRPAPSGSSAPGSTTLPGSSPVCPWSLPGSARAPLPSSLSFADWPVSWFTLSCRIGLLQSLHSHGDLRRDLNRHLTPRKRSPLGHPAPDAGGRAVTKQRRGHPLGQPFRRHHLHPEPGPAFFHLHRPGLDVQRSLRAERLAERLAVLRATIIQVVRQ